MSTEETRKKREDVTAAEAGLIWENRSRLIAVEGTTKYIEKALKSIEEKLDRFILKFEQDFATKEYVDQKIELSKREYTPFVTGAGDIIKYVLIAVIGAALALIIK